MILLGYVGKPAHPRLTGMNLGMHAALSGLEDIALIALDNYIAGVRQDKFGKNIGIHIAEHSLKRATYKALQNPVARKQKSASGNTIESRTRY